MALLGATAVSLFTATCHAHDWPQWRGPQRNGVSQEKGLLAEWPKAGPALLWSVADLGAGYSTPSVVGDRLYLMGNAGLENEFVEARSAKNGQRLWSTRVGKVGNPKQEPNYPARPLDTHGPRQDPLRPRLGWRPGLPRVRHGQGALAEKSAHRFRRQTRRVGVRRIAAH